MRDLRDLLGHQNGLPGIVPAGERRDELGVRPADGPPLLIGDPIGPWRGRVAVSAWHTRTGMTYRIEASWTGPPLPGPQGDLEPAATVQASDFVDVADQGDALAIARHAMDLLKLPERPDLQELARRARRR